MGRGLRKTPEGFLCLAKEFDIYSKGDKGFLMAFKQMGVLNSGGSMDNGLEKGKNPSRRYLGSTVREDKDTVSTDDKKNEFTSNNSRSPLARANPGEMDVSFPE